MKRGGPVRARDGVPESALLDVSTYPRDVLAETARHLRVIVDGWPTEQRGRPRYRWMVSMLAHLEAAVAQGGA